MRAFWMRGARIDVGAIRRKRVWDHVSCRGVVEPAFDALSQVGSRNKAK